MRQQQALRQQQLLADAKLKSTAVNDTKNMPNQPVQQPLPQAIKDLKETQRTAMEISQRLNKQAKPALSLTVNRSSFSSAYTRRYNYTFRQPTIILHFVRRGNTWINIEKTNLIVLAKRLGAHLL